MRASDRRADPPRPVGGQVAEQGDRRGSHQPAGRVVERLHRQRDGAVGARLAHPAVGDPGGHLHEAVEPAPPGPRPGPAVGVERDVDEARPDAPPLLIAEPEVLEGARPIAVHEHVGLGEQRVQSRTAAGGAGVQPRGALADRHVGHDAGLVPVGWVDPQHGGAEPGQRSGRDRAGEHAGEVEHPHARERPSGIRGPGDVPLPAPAADRDQRLAGHRGALGRGRPVGGGPHACGAAAGRDHLGLERCDGHAGDGRGDGIALRRHAEHAQGRRAMVRRVGVQPDPAVGAAVVAGDRIPGRRRRPAVGDQRRAEPRGAPVAVHDGRLALDEVGDGVGESGDGRTGQRADREGRREPRVPADRRTRGHRQAPGDRLPEHVLTVGRHSRTIARPAQRGSGAR